MKKKNSFEIIGAFETIKLQAVSNIISNDEKP